MFQLGFRCALRNPYSAIKRRLLSGNRHDRTRLPGTTNEELLQPGALKNHFQTLPTELVLLIFSFLELKPYILSHAVCKSWQALLTLAEIHPIRRRLFNLFKQMLSCPDFHKTRPWVLNNLQAFDRQAYIDTLLLQHPYIPEGFRLWILEWPARVANCCLWPGLSLVQCIHPQYDQPSGVNWLSYKQERPELSALVFDRGTPAARFIPALLLWRDDWRTKWLIFEKDESHPELFGSILILDDQVRGETSAVFPARWKVSPEDTYAYGGQGVAVESVLGKEYVNTLYPNWINYQEYVWDNWLRRILLSPTFKREEYAEPDREVRDPPTMDFDSGIPSQLPSPSWSARCEPAYQHYLSRT